MKINKQNGFRHFFDAKSSAIIRSNNYEEIKKINRKTIKF